MNAREKGKRGEREAAALLREHGFVAARRAQQYCGEAGDADVVGVPGWFIEVKNTATTRLPEWIGKAKADAGKQPWAILWKKPRDGWYAVIPAGEWLRLLARGGDADQ